MVKINKEVCIGCGACVSICPDVFEMNDDGKADVKSGANTNADCVKDAIDSCPVDAII